jgi:phospholipid transport system substrate-binding protein
MIRAFRPFLLAFLLVGLFASTPVLANDDAELGPSANAHDDAVKIPSGKFIQDLGNQAIDAIANKNITPSQRTEKFRQILSNSFDLMTIGRFVIGRSWNVATQQEQKDYMNLFESLVVKTYGDRLTLYTGEGFVVTSARPESEKDYIVNSQITHPDGSPPTSIDWRVRKRDGKLGVIDVVVEGVSLSVTQRQEYSAIIQNNNGQIAPLLDKMRQQLSVPTPQAMNKAG